LKRFIPKSSTLLFLTILMFLIFSFVSYTLLSKNLSDNYKKNQEIIFYKIQKKTNDLLTKLFYEFLKEKDILLQKHKEVLAYLENKSFDISLKDINEILNKNLPNKPYNIYITDENLVIKNTTYPPDLNLDLSFAKEIFYKHKKNNIIGVSSPIFEIYSSTFFSYTDSFLSSDNKRVLQVSFTYDSLKKELSKLKRLIDSNIDIKSSNAFIVYNDGYIGDFIFKLSKQHKLTLEEIEERIKKGKKLSKYINENEYLTSNFKINSDSNDYKIAYLSEKSPIFDDAKVVYSIVFDESKYRKELQNLNIITIIISILGMLTIYIIYKVRYKESLLNYKDKFIEHSVHEIKTPLSIISLNIQLRNKILGEDKYSKKIEGALKILENAYEDMTFLHTKEKIDYKIESLDLENCIKNRIKFFETIAQIQNRTIQLESHVSNKINIKMSKIELYRLVDNNLSNAIKYSKIGSIIKVIIKDNKLKFQSSGNKIKNMKDIFKKYVRENSNLGGHGLGLAIVKDICDKYKIIISVESKNSLNTFSYTFNCHNYDTRKL